MKMTFRWYGNSDSVTPEKIRQIPKVSGIVSAVYTKKPGEVWDFCEIDGIKRAAAEHGLEFEVVESVPVHEDIKLWTDDAPRLCEVYCENLRRLAAAGVKCVCYNFMPVFDWLRSELSRRLPDGSYALAYDENTMAKMKPGDGGLSLPGWDESYSADRLRGLLAEYENTDEEKLWKNYFNFLCAVIPTAERCDIKMAVHPDDPPWGVFGLPRIITGAKSYERLFAQIPSDANCITFCTGSLGADQDNNLVRMAADYADRTAFAHLRNIRRTGCRCFEETAHPTDCGSLDMYAIVKALADNGFDGYVRPDHGRSIWGERGRHGYGLYDRALGAAYLNGLFEAVQNQRRHENG